MFQRIYWLTINGRKTYSFLSHQEASAKADELIAAGHDPDKENFSFTSEMPEVPTIHPNYAKLQKQYGG